MGDRIRITAGGKTKDGKHRLSNGSLYSIEGFTRRGDIVVDHGWVIDRDFGHLTHGYATTSHSSQGVTVDKVFVGVSSESFPATYQRTAYVALTRGKEQAVIFTDDRQELLKAFGRTDDPLSATEISRDMQPQLAHARLDEGATTGAVRCGTCGEHAKATSRPRLDEDATRVRPIPGHIGPAA